MKKHIQLIFLFIALMILGACNQNPSSKVLFNNDWQFTISDASFEEVQQLNIWEAVTLPHTAVIEPKIVNNQWQGICWYRKRFTLPENAKGQRLILRFEGAMNVSEYWINGQKVKEHLGGYLPAVFDFTEVANFNGENIIYVRLDNTDNPVTGPKPLEILDFNMYGGLYRDAFLLIKNPLNLSDPILADKTASGGIFVTYPEVSREKATIHVQSHVTNQSDKSKTFTVLNEIWKDNQLLATELSSKTQLNAGTSTEVISQIELENPSLWSPDSPSLYQLKTKILVKGKILEEETTTIGIKHLAFEKGKLVLNGDTMFLRGVNRHQEYPYVGYALSNEAQYRDAYKIKAAGFDYVRLSHYPHSPAFMDACNELGLLVLDAILGWQYYSRDSAFQQQIFKTARELVRRDRNHPCVLAWEVSLNESWMDEPFIDELHRIAHDEYPGDQCYTAGWQEHGYDIYLQARQHRLNHYRTPEKPYSVSEYGDWEYYAQNAGFSQDSWADLKEGERSSRQLLTDGEARLLQQATNIQEAHNDNFNTPAFSDSYWVMFDYNRGYAEDLEASGIMSIDRLPKFSYYFFQSQREATAQSALYPAGPMVHIASWWTAQSPANVRVYSNAQEVELFLNGKSLGKQKPDQNRISGNLAHPPFTFNIRKFELGELLAKAYIDGKEAASHVVRTPGEKVALSLEIDKSGRTPRAGVNDVLFVYARLMDTQGNIVRENDVKVDFIVEGDAQILNPQTIFTEAGIATALIRIGHESGKVNIKASTGEIQAEVLSFEVRK